VWLSLFKATSDQNAQSMLLITSLSPTLPNHIYNQINFHLLSYRSILSDIVCVLSMNLLAYQLISLMGKWTPAAPCASIIRWFTLLRKKLSPFFADDGTSTVVPGSSFLDVYGGLRSYHLNLSKWASFSFSKGYSDPLHESVLVQWKTLLRVLSNFSECIPILVTNAMCQLKLGKLLQHHAHFDNITLVQNRVKVKKYTKTQ